MLLFLASITATAVGIANATIVAPVAIVHPKTAALSFGTFSTGAGSVTITPAGARTVTGAVGVVNVQPGTADSFTLSGANNAFVTIATGAGVVTSGSTLPAFTTKPSVDVVQLSSTGTGAFTVGGTLTLVGTEPAGLYNGTYSVTVSYQ